jgi:hypothetical protein
VGVLEEGGEILRCSDGALLAARREPSCERILERGVVQTILPTARMRALDTGNAGRVQI